MNSSSRSSPEPRHACGMLAMLALGAGLAGLFTVAGAADIASELGAAQDHGDETPSARTLEAEALLLRARELRATGTFDDAESAYQDAIALLESEFGEFSGALATPLVELGETYNAAGRHLEALVVMERARHLHRRAFGLQDPSQMDAIWGLIRAYHGMGDEQESRRWLEEVELLAQRAHADDPDALLAAHARRAAWFAERGFGHAQRDVYEQMLEIQYSELPEERARRSTLLREIAHSWTHQTPMAMRFALDRRSARRVTQREPRDAAGQREAHAALEAATRLFEDDPDAPVDELARLSIAWAHWHLVWDREPDEAITRLEHAWALLEDTPELRDEYLGRAEQVYFVPPVSPGHRARGEPHRGYARVAFTIGPDGRAHDIEVVDADPPGMIDDALVDQLARTGRFRPRMSDGAPVATPGAHLTQRFTYRVREDD